MPDSGRLVRLEENSSGPPGVVFRQIRIARLCAIAEDIDYLPPQLIDVQDGIGPDTDCVIYGFRLADSSEISNYQSFELTNIFIDTLWCAPDDNMEMSTHYLQNNYFEMAGQGRQDNPVHHKHTVILRLIQRMD